MGEADRHPAPNGTDGTDDGCQAHPLLVPDEEIAVIALINLFDRDEGLFGAHGIASEVMKVLHGIEK